MATLLHGDRIGRRGTIQFGCSALVLDERGARVLLTRRTDNGRWCLPGGRMDPGESAAETCVREVLEETGLQVEVVRLVGLYSSPHLIVEYADGERRQIVAAHFLVRVVGGALQLSDETSAYGYFSREEIAALDVMEHHLERIADSFAEQEGAYIR
jgi:8-oxo-dGTP pyrophosphatase MutT (NUDIX family)